MERSESRTGAIDNRDSAAGETIDRLVDRYYRSIIRFFLERGFSIEESHDLTQDTFLRAYRYHGGFRGEARASTWLFHIASNIYRGELRTRAAQKRSAEILELDGLGEVALDGLPWADRGKPDPLSRLLLGERTRTLQNAIEDLPQQVRRATILRVRQDLKYREVAEVLNVSIETVKSHLHQAKSQLREKLGTRAA